ncbi:beta-ketoacyl synthase N-terminal-like domain-containing protein [Streptomyces diastatochromogenes]|nr:beta-ketoacyl synthase N-terminal-like domain-containing protein [Streptomyces diastatochromogenes]MCZ0982946.1 beta-ketoacyl synthase N-terminal-like domain-containing protein [Streptomyces diastatochromogenes]
MRGGTTRNDTHRDSHHLPPHAVAVVGIGCRFPQADDPDAFWPLLHDGHDALTDRPNGRGPARTGFLDHIDRFDPDFFGISHREAVTMDPQQRLALELAWQALEDARLPPHAPPTEPRPARRRLGGGPTDPGTTPLP